MKQKLEFTWIGKDQRSRLEPRIFLENSKCSCREKPRVMDATVGMYGDLQGSRCRKLRGLSLRRSKTRMENNKEFEPGSEYA